MGSFNKVNDKLYSNVVRNFYYEYPMNFAMLAQKNYIPHFGLLSSKETNINSVFESI